MAGFGAGLVESGSASLLMLILTPSACGHRSCAIAEGVDPESMVSTTGVVTLRPFSRAFKGVSGVDSVVEIRSLSGVVGDVPLLGTV